MVLKFNGRGEGVQEMEKKIRNFNCEGAGEQIKQQKTTENRANTYCVGINFIRVDDSS